MHWRDDSQWRSRQGWYLKFIEPPDDNGDQSEEDSDNEDQPISLDHLSSRQLAAGAELIVRTRGQSAELQAVDEGKYEPPESCLVVSHHRESGNIKNLFLKFVIRQKANSGPSAKSCISVQ